MTEYVNIREILGAFVGQRVVDITQHDEEEFRETGQSYIMLMFENGNTLKIFVGDEGFIYTEESSSAEE